MLIFFCECCLLHFIVVLNTFLCNFASSNNAVLLTFLIVGYGFVRLSAHLPAANSLSRRKI